jgi:uncharacterized damage-inducible protein DinB
MNRLARHFATMAYNNAWANYRLLTAVGKLTPEHFAAKRVSFFPSLKSTLNHNVTVDWYYVDALARGLRSQPVTTFSAPVTPCCAPPTWRSSGIPRQ